MSGGGSKPPPYQPVQQQDVKIEPVPQTQLQTDGYGGMGYTQVPQTYTPESAPSWMKGGTMDLGGQGYQGMGGLSGKAPGQSMPNWYQMPSWGTDAVTGQALTQEQLQPKAYEPPPAQAGTPDWGAGNYAPRATGGWLDQYKAGVMDKNDARQMLRYQGLSNLEAERKLNMTVRHPMTLGTGSRWRGNDVG